MLPAMVADTNTVRGMRWEYFTFLTTVTPCINMKRIVFGPDAAYDQFIERTHDALVEWPSEEGLFALARRGWLGSGVESEPTLFGRLWSVSMRSGPATCGEMVQRRFDSLEEMM